ncbi:hypothetical protein [Rhodopirellula sp. P2]|uniref:hypothetical protein n=1 Tax=Rhodopirellula sp. P2 TaxID=2127060 RepID=UPI002367D341|nr:hypothetical protein [Rhodopirellula sp. P2]WDQ17188.1 hypothetical protein PSR62_01220 [Rhodopirellula sp. P2]
MVRLARCEVFDPDEVAVAHVWNRTCRRCFLLGDDSVSGKNFDHRKVWIEDLLHQFAAEFGIDLLGFAILSNHFHLILRTRPDVVASWSDEEVAARWCRICPHNRKPDGSPAEPTKPEIRAIAGCPVKLAEIRQRLSSLSWWMRLLCQRVSMRANAEEDESGRFFQDRYKATRLVDEASLLACSAYVDLNLIRAAMAQTLETSDHTSVQRRIEAAQQDVVQTQDATQALKEGPERQTKRPDAFLSPLTIDEASDPISPDPSPLRDRCSEKGFLAMSLVDYLELLDWTARQSIPGKGGTTPASVAAVLKRLGLDGTAWCELAGNFGKLFGNVAGRPESVDSIRSHQTQRRYHLRRRARELMTTA